MRAQLRAQKLAQETLAQSADAEARRLVEAGVVAPPRGSSSLLRGKIGQYRGRMAEQRLVRLLNESPDRPAWLIEAQRAPEDVDQLGVDVLVYTADLGTLPLQVKSSRGAAEEYPRSHPEIATIVGIVVAPIEMPDADAWAAVMAELGRLREMVQPSDGGPDQRSP
jgi:hypothetical protein